MDIFGDSIVIRNPCPAQRTYDHVDGEKLLSCRRTVACRERAVKPRKSVVSYFQQRFCFFRHHRQHFPVEGERRLGYSTPGRIRHPQSIYNRGVQFLTQRPTYYQFSHTATLYARCQLASFCRLNVGWSASGGWKLSEPKIKERPSDSALSRQARDYDRVGLRRKELSDGEKRVLCRFARKREFRRGANTPQW